VDHAWRVVLLVAAIIAFTLSFASRADAFIYWSSGGETIGRANLDGTGADPIFLNNEGNGGALRLAVNGDYIYWNAEPSFSEAIGRASLDRNDINYRFISFPSPSTGVENVTVAGGHIYWTAQLSESIGRANLDGTGVDNNFISLDPGNPDGVVGDDAADVAVDGGHIYWTRSHGDYSDPGGIGRANLDASGIDPNFIAAGPGRYPHNLAVDGEHIYWTEFERFGSNPTIGQANLDGSGVNPNFISLPAQGEDLAVDAGHIYWVQGFSAIGRANLDGTGVEGSFIPQSALGGNAFGLAVDSLTSETGRSEISLGKVKKNKKKGTAKLTVNVRGPGILELLGTKKVKSALKFVDAAGKEKLSVKSTGKAKKRLNAKGKAKLKAEVSFESDSGTLSTEAKKIKLVKR
jgi:virginiamycin B lyase